jgi:hypothetical protein
MLARTKATKAAPAIAVIGIDIGKNVFRRSSRHNRELVTRSAHSRLIR